MTTNLDNQLAKRLYKVISNNASAAQTSTPITTGVVVQNDNDLYVAIDDETLVPISETNSNVQVGDKVTLAIDDEQALIVGNISDQNATSSEVAQTNVKVAKAQESADDASKVATNYIDIDENNGITVGNMQDETLGKNTYIDANGVSIRDGETCLAHFRDNEIALGENSDSSTISLCNSKGLISYTDEEGLKLQTWDTGYPVYPSCKFCIQMGESMGGTMSTKSAKLQNSEDGLLLGESFYNGYSMEGNRAASFSTENGRDVVLTAHSGYPGSPLAYFRTNELRLTPLAFTLNDSPLTLSPRDSETFTFYGAGYVTNSGLDVHFQVPINKVMCGITGATVTTAPTFIIRENNKYCYNATYSAGASASTIILQVKNGNSLHVLARFANTSNVTNNSPVGVEMTAMTVTFS